jgi:hypothetical protein
MRASQSFRPRFERLEDRTCPALSLQQVGGLLTVSGVPTSGNVFIHETGAHVITVQDGTSTPAVYRNVRNLSVSLGSADNSVDIDLGGYGFGGSINVTFASGSNALSIEHGTVGFLNIHGGHGDNDITLGDGVTLFKVRQQTIVGLGGNAYDTLTVGSTTTVAGTLTVNNTASVTLNSGSAISQNAVFYAASTGTVVVDAATVRGNVQFFGSYAAASGQDTLQVNGTVGGSVVFNGSLTNTVGDELDISANVGRNVTFTGSGAVEAVNVAPGVRIGGNLTIAFAGGNDSIDVGDTAVIGGAALFNLGNGLRQVTFGGTVGNNSNALVLAIVGGYGSELVTFTSGATFRGRAALTLSRGSANTVTFLSRKVFNTHAITIDGGFAGLNTLNLNGTGGSKLGVRNFAMVNR